MYTVANTIGARTSQSRPRQRTPRGLYTTPFAGMALMMACLMVIPIPRMVPIPQARADGANGSCQFSSCTEEPFSTCYPNQNDPDGPPICVSGTTTVCSPDLNDPDCFPGLYNLCLCNDRTVFPIKEPVTLSACNTSATCLDHCGPASPSTGPNGCGGGFTLVGGCERPLRLPDGGAVCAVLTRASADVHAFHPDTGAPLVNQSLSAGPQLEDLEKEAISEVLQIHGLPDTESANVMLWARDRVRAQLFTKFVAIINKTKADHTTDEQVLYDWLTNLVWQRRIDAAQESWNQYQAFIRSVQYGTCAWHSPNETGIVVTQGAGTTTLPGCSPGVDGIPGTDTTPNAGSIEDIALGRDDGETCFTFHDFTRADYDSNTNARCNGSQVAFDVFGIAAHPTIEDFLAYGQALARKRLTLDPGFASVIGNTYKAAFFGAGVGVAGLAGLGTGFTIYARGGWQAFAKVFAPYAFRVNQLAIKAGVQTAAEAGKIAAQAGRIVSAIGVAAVVTDIIFSIITAIQAITEIVEFNNIPIALKKVVLAAAGPTETAVPIQPDGKGATVTTGKPDLTVLILTNEGKEEIFYAFLEAVAPEINLINETAPQPDSTVLWNVRDASTNQSVPLTPPHLLPFTSWDGAKPWHKQTAGLFGGWFDVQTATVNGTVAKALELGIDYKDCAGKERRAWRVAGEEFVSVPHGTVLADADLTKTTKSKEFQYLDWAGQCRIARINQPPTATIAAVSGTLQEGQPVSLSGTGSDADGDAVSLVWDFGDGTGTATGASVQHAFADNGPYAVTLTPTDAHGVQGTAQTQIVTVANVPPTITSATLTGAINEGQTASLAAAFTDLGVHDSHTVTVDWGDGSAPATAMSAGGYGGGSVTLSHVYGDNRASYPVTITVTDKDGDTASTTKSIRVDNVAPTGALQLSPGAVPEGSAFSVSFTNIVDPSPVDTAAGFQYAFNCGGGYGAFSSTNAVTCTPTDNGLLTVAGQIKDKDGERTESTATITVTSVAPTATFTATAQIFQGETSTLAFSNQFDPSSADTQAGFVYAYDCTTNGTVSVANNRSATATCTYLKTGTFTVGGTIKDKDQEATKYTATVAVLAPQQATTTLMSQVQALASQGVLNSGQTNGLTVKLTGAIDKFKAGKKADAVSVLQSFISQVNDLVNKDHVLSPAQGQSLTSVANRIIAAINVS